MDEAKFVADMLAELVSARSKFPGREANFTALVEEVGEVAQALLSEDHERVYKECVQVAVMAARVALELDSTLDDYREKRSLNGIEG